MKARTTHTESNEVERTIGLSGQQIQQEFFQAIERDGVLNMNEFANLYSRFPDGRNQQNSSS
jgi:hypothetical protein